ASALARAQAFLRRYQYGLKIWDAYRPVGVQARLWEASHNSDYVADPKTGAGSLHSWGIAIDATLVDSWNNPVRMPSDFDDFAPAGIRPCFAQSTAGLRIAHCLDRTGYRRRFKEPSRSACHLSTCPCQLAFRVAGL